MAKFCPACGHPVSLPQSRYCQECGMDLSLLTAPQLPLPMKKALPIQRSAPNLTPSASVLMIFSILVTLANLILAHVGLLGILSGIMGFIASKRRGAASIFALLLAIPVFLFSAHGALLFLQLVLAIPANTEAPVAAFVIITSLLALYALAALWLIIVAAQSEK